MDWGLCLVMCNRPFRITISCFFNKLRWAGVFGHGYMITYILILNTNGHSIDVIHGVFCIISNVITYPWTQFTLGLCNLCWISKSRQCCMNIRVQQYACYVREFMVYCMIYIIYNQHLQSAPETAVILRGLVAKSLSPKSSHCPRL